MLWWWVGVVGERGGQEWESSSLFTGCCGRRGAVGENDGPWEWVVSLDSTSLVPARWNHVQSVGCCECCDHSLDQRNCYYGCTRPLPESGRYLMCSHVFSFFSQEAAAKGPRQNGETGRSTGQRWEDLGGNKTTQTKTRSKWMRARQSRAPSRKHRCQKSRMRNFEIQGEYGLGTVHVGVQYIQRPNSAEKKNQSLSRASRSLPVKAV